MPRRPHKYEDLGRTSRWMARKRLIVSDSSDSESSENGAFRPGAVLQGAEEHRQDAPRRAVETFTPVEEQGPVRRERLTGQDDPQQEAAQQCEEPLQALHAVSVDEQVSSDEHSDRPNEDAGDDATSESHDSSVNSGYSEEDVQLDMSEDEDLAGDDGPYDVPLYDGAPISLFESLLSILSFVLAHNLTGSCLADLLVLISLHCTNPNLCKKTCYFFHKYFAEMKSPVICHYYCRKCFKGLQTKDSVCNLCGENVGVDFFIEMPIVDQLRRVFLRRGFVDKLSYRSSRLKRNNANYEDIYDGTVYSEFMNNLLGDTRNISFMWNTDGISLFKSSKYSVWPFYLTVNELPPNERFLKQNVLLAGLWFGPHKPAPNLSFHSGIQELYTGIDVQVPNAEVPRRIRGVVLCGTCDLPAKSLFFNMKQFNGYYGCPKCKIRGENSKRTGNVHVYPYEQEIDLRTDAETSNFAQQAFNSGQAVFGIKGPTVLSLLVPNFIRSTLIDVMHCVYLGVVKHLLKLWFDASFHSEAYSLSRLINVVSSRMASIKPPHFIQSLPRAIGEHLAYWKASELRSWMYYYSMPVLFDVMDQVYFSHYISFILGVFLLNKDSISREDITFSSQLLDRFVYDFENLYGVRYMSCNIHLLRHLPMVVQDLGPLWTTSCFKYENMNGILKNLVHGTRHAGVQIQSSLSLFCNLPSMVGNLPPNSCVKNFCERVGSKSKKMKMNEQIDDNTFTVGKHGKPVNVPDLILYALDEVHNIRRFFMFSRLKKGNLLFVAESYNRDKATSSSCVKCLSGDENHLGIIQNFVKVTACHCLHICRYPGRYFAIVRRMNSMMNSMCPFRTSYPVVSLSFAHQCTLSDNIHAVEVFHLASVLFKIIINNCTYVIEAVNCQELE